MKLYFITAKPRSNGMDYVDTTVTINHFNNYEDNVNEFIATLSEYITDWQSIVLHRSEVQRFIDTIVDSQEELKHKDLFNKIRRRLRSEFDVCRIRFNPRTMALSDKSFIIHKRVDMRSR